MRRLAFILCLPVILLPQGPARPLHRLRGVPTLPRPRSTIAEKTPACQRLRDPQEHPRRHPARFDEERPALTFTRDDIAFTYGSKWKQRYFKRWVTIISRCSPMGTFTHQIWRPYLAPAGSDWWTAFYPADNMQRPNRPAVRWLPSVNYNIETKGVTEWNVGCEKCHGLGRPRAAALGDKYRESGAAGLRSRQRRLHSMPLAGPSIEESSEWQVLRLGRRVPSWRRAQRCVATGRTQTWRSTFTHFPDGTAHKNRMQGNDFTSSLMYTHGVTCFSCHDVHGTANNADLLKPASTLCLECHGPNSPNGPRAASIEQHTHHKLGSRGSECIECHMPKIEQTIADVSVRAHTFRFITPGMTAALRFRMPAQVVTPTNRSIGPPQH